MVDHSVQVDFSASSDALRLNMEMEFKRNQTRYQFLKWGTRAFDGFNVVPPGIGIVHQVNLEYLAKGVLEQEGIYYPDTLVGTDSHTTMINGLGIVGWGVGGIEAEAGMLGQPVYFLTPDVVGVYLTGSLREGVTATDLALTITQMLRKAKVVEVVEFWTARRLLAVADRATIANMALMVRPWASSRSTKRRVQFCRHGTQPGARGDTQELLPSARTLRDARTERLRVQPGSAIGPCGRSSQRRGSEASAGSHRSARVEGTVYFAFPKARG